MPTPANNITGATGLQVDQKIVAGAMLDNLKTVKDFGADYSTEFTAPINGQRTSTVLVRTKISLTLADMPASRDGLLARTSVTGGSVEVGLKADKYFKVGVDDQGVAPGQVEQEVGAAGAEAIARYGNTDLIETLEADGTAVYFGKVFAGVADDPATTGEDETQAPATAQDVWTALLNQVTAYQEADYTDEVILYVRPAVWNRLIGEVASLTSATDKQATAAQLLGVAKVHVANLANSLAVFAHRGAVAQAKVLSGIRSAQEDFDSIVEGRIKVGTKVLDTAAVRVLRDGAGA